MPFMGDGVLSRHERAFSPSGDPRSGGRPVADEPSRRPPGLPAFGRVVDQPPKPPPRVGLPRTMRIRVVTAKILGNLKDRPMPGVYYYGGRQGPLVAVDLKAERVLPARHAGGARVGVGASFHVRPQGIVRPRAGAAGAPQRFDGEQGPASGVVPRRESRQGAAREGGIPRLVPGRRPQAGHQPPSVAVRAGRGGGRGEAAECQGGPRQPRIVRQAAGATGPRISVRRSRRS